MKLCETKPDFFGKNLVPKNLENWSKIIFFEFFENLVINFLGIFSEMEIDIILLYSSTYPIADFLQADSDALILG